MLDSVSSRVSGDSNMALFAFPDNEVSAMVVVSQSLNMVISCVSLSSDGTLIGRVSRKMAINRLVCFKRAMQPLSESPPLPIDSARSKNNSTIACWHRARPRRGGSAFWTPSPNTRVRGSVGDVPAADCGDPTGRRLAIVPIQPCDRRSFAVACQVVRWTECYFLFSLSCV